MRRWMEKSKHCEPGAFGAWLPLAQLAEKTLWNQCVFVLDDPAAWLQSDLDSKAYCTDTSPPPAARIELLSGGAGGDSAAPPGFTSMNIQVLRVPANLHQCIHP